jgi:sec-independent protein translocase protein TatC
MTDPGDVSEDREQPLVAHLAELRDRLLRSMFAVLAIFLALSFFSKDIYAFLAEPLMRRLPSGSGMIATEVASPFLAPFKLTLFVALFIAIPYLLYQAWAFVAPGLYRNERRLVLPLVISSTVLFYAGMAFAYYVVFPLIFAFFTSVAPEGVTVMTDISRYLDFVLKMFFAFGVAFEVPIATILLIRADVISLEAMASKRPYVIVGAFVIGMLLTPPDVVSQCLLALPMWFLFEAGILVAKFLPDQDDHSTVGEAD